MRLFIAEKPSMGMEIAKVLANKNNKLLERSDGFISVGNDVVTWQFGHILELKSASELDPQYEKWSFDTLPIIPQNWQRKIKDDCVKQFNVIKKLIENTDEIIHAGDPDREGELLIRETLIHLNNTKPVKRILLNALDEKSILYALDNLKDDSVFDNLYISAEARTRADWLIGINLTRAYTLIGKDNGLTTSINIGRVMTPTFSLVVQRENEIRQFNATKYYSLTAIFKSNKDEIQTKLKVPDEIKENDYVIDKTLIEDIENKLKKNPLAIISDYTVEKKTEYPLLPYSLSELQLVAGKKYNYEPKLVLDTVQSLYEKKLTTYPRSDCSYLPENQFDNATEILNTLSNIDDNFKTLIQEANPKLKSKAWNDKKITAHHAIIPTIVKAEELDNTQQKIYEMIAKRYILQFFLPCIAEKTTFVLSVADEIFTGSGQIIMEAGFKAFEGKETSDINILPELKVGDKIDKGDYLIQEKKTTPPKRFTEGTLLAAMANIYKYVDAKNPNREKLKEVKGIGTPATRDTIIAELQDTVSKGRDIEPCLKKVKRELVPTAFGINLIENIDKSLTYPDTTAEMEYKLSEIAEGKQSLQDFVDNVINMVYDNIKFAENKEFPFYRDNDSITCPICNKGQIVRKYSAKIDKYFHMCNNPDCVSPVTGKKLFFEDNNGKPIIAKCPNCKNLLVKKLGKNGEFWLCQKCNKTYNDKNGKPEI